MMMKRLGKALNQRILLMQQNDPHKICEIRLELAAGKVCEFNGVVGWDDV